MTASHRALAAVSLIWLMAQSALAEPALVRVAGEVPHPLELTAEEFARLRHETVRVKDHAGVEAEYRGVPLAELLTAAGLKLGSDLRGPALALYLVVEAEDGYRALFAIPELAPAFAERPILVADQRDGKPLDAKEGPLRIIVPGDKRRSRWVKHAKLLKIGRAP